MRPERKRPSSRLLTRRSLLGLAGVVCATAALGAVPCALAIGVAEPCRIAAVADDASGFDGADLRIDWYKVADAVKQPGQDAYGFEPVAAFAEAAAGLSHAEALDAAAYAAMAEACARVVLQTGLQPSFATAPGIFADTGAGLYLALVRPADGELVLEEVDRDGEAAVACVVESATKRFAFAPQLAAVPTKEPDEYGQISSANDGPWDYEAQVLLKHSVDDRMASVVIRKSFTVFDSDTVVECVFQIDAYRDEARTELLYSNVAALSVSDGASRELTLADIVPAGSYVEVTELYAGAAYVAADDAVCAGRAWADEPFVASFVNRYDRQQVRGGGVDNAFSYNGERWEWSQGSSEGGDAL